MVAVAVAAASPITVGRRELLFDDPAYVSISNGTGYDVHPDGHFLMVRRGSGSDEVVVILNWFEQMRAGLR